MNTLSSLKRNALIAMIAGFSLASPVVAQDVTEGEALYLNHCADCHGVAVDGNGSLANAMIMKPKNLRLLAQQNDGVFPMLTVIKRIDGRDPLVSHGSPMPVFGQYFEGDDTALKTASGQPVMTSRSIADLVAYLQEQQQ
ncbi:MAG: c-type cytochrome [Rhodobacterales bacterium]|nr:c-type cytochrome [Rhodobacterales bacterium]